MFEELSKTIKAQLYERASSPLLGSFALSWLAWNYRFVIVLLSGMAAPEKFRYIDTSLYLSWEEAGLRGGLYPLITALLLIFVYPIPARYVYEYWRKQQRALKEIQQRIDDETPLTKEEARQLRREALKASGEYEQEIERRTADIARLKELVADLEARVALPQKEPQSDPVAPNGNTEPPLDDSQIEMLKSIAGAPGALTQKALIASSGEDRIRSEYNLGELERREFITSNFSVQQRDYIVKATHPGRAYLMKNSATPN